MIHTGGWCPSFPPGKLEREREREKTIERERFKMRKMKNEGKKIWTKRERKGKRGDRKIECRKVRSEDSNRWQEVDGIKEESNLSGRGSK